MGLIPGRSIDRLCCLDRVLGERKGRCPVRTGADGMKDGGAALFRSQAGVRSGPSKLQHRVWGRSPFLLVNKGEMRNRPFGPFLEFPGRLGIYWGRLGKRESQVYPFS